MRAVIVALAAHVALAARVSSSAPAPSFGLRLPPEMLAAGGDDDGCATLLCAGAGATYPIGPGVAFSGVFDVPPLPEIFDDAAMTYYDYLNIFWRANPDGGWMNQFVPQLMLGNALCNSSGAPDYRPHWAELDAWHIGAQYFFGVCDAGRDGGYNCTKDSWTAHAATGDLIAVAPGERVWTNFTLSDEWVWTLGMGVVGAPARASFVTVARPFMGLVNGSASWREPTYAQVYDGSCWENYGMVPGSFPRAWSHNMTVASDAPADWWHAWQMDATADCSWAPLSALDSEVAADGASQVAHWRLYYDDA